MARGRAVDRESSYGYSSDSGSSDSGSKPVLLDLSGKGLSVDTLGVSDNFFDFDGDGYQRRTAWAGTGTGVLVFDADGDGKISRSSEFAFTEWDKSSTSDLEALRRVFDTNNNNKLDSGDAHWADFKVWLNGALVSLASQKIASIGLIASGSGQSFEDGSAITGTSIFTRTDGTTGTAADAVLAAETDSHIVKTTSVTNADGSKTATITALDKDGSLAFRNVVTTSANGLSVTTKFDDDGDGTYDRSQTDVRTTTGGVQKRVVSNFNADGSLQDRTTTTVSADLATITTDVDQDGDGKRDQSQIYQTNADGSTSTTVTQFSVTGAVLKRILTTGSADGLTRTIKTDEDGNGAYERVRTEKTVVGTDGGRTKTVEERGTATGATGLISSQATTTSANGQTTTVRTDGDGNGTYETYTTTKIDQDASGASRVTADLYSSKNVLLTRAITTTSLDALSKVEQFDLDGDGAIDRTRSDTTVAADSGALTQTVTEKSRSGALLTSEVTKTSADRKTITVDSDLDGDGKLDVKTSILIDANGVTTSTETHLSDSGATVEKITAVTSADGLSTTTRTDRTGDGANDTIVTDVTSGPAGGSRTRTVTTTSGNGTLLGRTAVTTTADGLVQTTREDRDADGTYDLTTVDTTKLNADGSRSNAVVNTSADGTLQSRVDSLVSADRKTVTTSSDTDGDGKIDETTVAVTKTDGSSTETDTTLSAGGQTLGVSYTTVSANGLTTTLRQDLDGDGTYDLTTTTAVTLNSDGSRTTTQTKVPTGNPTAPVSKTLTTVTGNGLKTDIRTDADGNGVYEERHVEQTTLNDDGSVTVRQSLLNSTITLSQTAVTTSASKLSVTTQSDLDGNNIYESTVTAVTVANADGSQTMTAEEKSSGGALISRQTVATKANGHDVTTSNDRDGDGVIDDTRSVLVNADGSTTTVVKTLNAGKLASQSTDVVSANGLSHTVSVDANGDGTLDRVTSDITTLNANGSTTEVYTENGAATSTVTIDISADGLTKKTVWAGAGGATKRSSTETSVLNDDGGSQQTLSLFKADGSPESKTTTTVSAHGTTTTTTQDIDGDGDIDGKVVTSELSDGRHRQIFTDYSAANVVKDVRTVITTADGFGQTIDFDTGGNGSVEERISSATVLNTDGSRTTTSSTSVAVTSGLALRDKTQTDVSANGLKVKTQWDTDGTGTFDKSRTDETILNADGSKTETVSTFTGTALTSRYETRRTGNGLTVTMQWDQTGTGSYVQGSTDATVFGTDGTSTRTVTSTKGDGSVISKLVEKTSADRETVTTTITETGQASRTVTETTATLADGAVRKTTTSRSTGTSTFTEKTVTLTSADKRTVTIDRDTNGDGIVEQREETVKALFGEETTTLTDLNSNGSLKDRMTIVRSADGRRTTTTWDRDGNGASDRTRIVDDVTNLDGSRVRTTTETDQFNAKAASKTVVKVSADGLLTTTTRDIGNDGTIDQTEQVKIDPTGATTTTLANKTAAALDAGTLPAGFAQWKAAAAETVITMTSPDGRTTTSTFAYAEDKAGVVTRTTVVMRQVLQIDGSIVTAITETNAAGAVMAKGQITTSMDGRTTVLTRDTDNNGVTDSRETAVTALDGSIVLTKVELKADGTASKTTIDKINALGSLVSSIAVDANNRKTSELTVSVTGNSVLTTFDGASGAKLSVTNATNGIVTSSVVYDPLNNDTNKVEHVERIFDSAGILKNEDIYYDDGTKSLYYTDQNNEKWTYVTDTYDKGGSTPSKKQIKYDNSLYVVVIYDLLNADKLIEHTEITYTADYTLTNDYKLTNQDTYYDDGTKTLYYTDFTIEIPWSAVADTYDVGGTSPSKKVIKWDDSTWSIAFYDLSNKERWLNYDKLYNSEEDISTNNFKIQTTYNDDGTKDVITFDIPDTHEWTRIDKHTTPSGTTSQINTNDDGSRIEYFWDQDNKNKWSTMTDYYNTPGYITEYTNFLTKETVNYDDKSRTEYSVYRVYLQGQRDYYTDKTDYYDASGKYYKSVANGHKWTYTGPVLLDMNHDDQIDFLPRPEGDQAGQSTITFDWDGDQTPDQTAWVGPQDGFLAIDLAADGTAGPDGVINQARELAFSLWPDDTMVSSGDYVSDLDGLRISFDTNQDGILSALDDRWSEFRVWQDLNQNGISDAGELQTMAEAGISLVNLEPSSNGAQAFSDGSTITGTSFYETLDGQRYLTADVTLGWQPNEAAIV